MTNSIIYEDDKSCVVFCEDGRIFFRDSKSGNFYNAVDIVKSLPRRMKDKAQMIEKYLSMNYKEAARLHLKYSIHKKRYGKLKEGDFYEKD